ncbi:hypothetical protein DFH09DRAFT_1309715 [Mycena vulgaris]|nr:hypothetical protein DFH09DRAFT_1309715 [Mycena vulgaris]
MKYCFVSTAPCPHIVFVGLALCLLPPHPPVAFVDPLTPLNVAIVGLRQRPDVAFIGRPLQPHVAFISTRPSLCPRGGPPSSRLCLPKEPAGGLTPSFF